MAVIALVGPHAIGKTTAIRRWVAKYGSLGQLVGVSADNQLVYANGQQIKEKGWKGTLADKQYAMRARRASSKTLVVESGGPYATQIIKCLHPGDHVIFVWCTRERLIQCLQERCARSGKKFNPNSKPVTDAGYECRDRVHNALCRTNGLQIESFQIDNLVQDWETVDAYFGRIYRQIHNQHIVNAALARQGK